MTDKLVSTSDLARELGVSSRTVTRYVKQGKIKPFQRIAGGRHGLYLFERHSRDVEAMVAEVNAAHAPIKAQALREAARAWLEEIKTGAVPAGGDVAEWLTNRAVDLEDRN